MTAVAEPLLRPRVVLTGAASPLGERVMRQLDAHAAIDGLERVPPKPVPERHRGNLLDICCYNGVAPLEGSQCPCRACNRQLTPMTVDSERHTQPGY